ncbi:MAG: M24 family metallopeptidase [Planctomycetota bacterium]
MDLTGIKSGTVADRLEEFQTAIAREGLDAYWVAKTANVRYLSGFNGEAGTLMITRDRAVLITDSRFEEEARKEAEVDQVKVREDGMVETVGEVCKSLGNPKTGFTASNVTYADGQELDSVLPSDDVIPLSEGPVESMRIQKGKEEVEAIISATELAEEAFQAFSERVVAGRSEQWLSGCLEWEMKRCGAERAAFDTICAVDERASLPHARCTERELTEQSALLVDWGAQVDGYNSDLTRVLGTGTIPRRVCKLIEIVLDAQEAALQVLGPGVPCTEVDSAARDVIAASGYGGQFVHSLGHGVGLEVHEAPRLARGNAEELKTGMVVTVEPGIYIPEEVGVRVEEMIVVTSNGCEKISSLPTSEHWDV